MLKTFRGTLVVRACAAATGAGPGGSARAGVGPCGSAGAGVGPGGSAKAGVGPGGSARAGVGPRSRDHCVCEQAVNQQQFYNRGWTAANEAGMLATAAPHASWHMRLTSAKGTPVAIPQRGASKRVSWDQFRARATIYHGAAVHFLLTPRSG